MIEMSVVIPFGSRSKKNINRLIKSLSNQKTDFLFEILVIENPECNSQLDSQFSQQFNLSWLTSSRGANAARNKGLAAAKADLILFLDDDCVADDSNLLQKHFLFHKKKWDQKVVYAGLYKLPRFCSYWDVVYNKIQTDWIFRNILPDSSYQQALGGHFSIRKTNLGELRFDENLIFGGTETEFFVRLLQNQFQILLNKELAVTHHTKLHFLIFLSKSFRQGQGTSYLDSRQQSWSEFIYSQNLLSDNKKINEKIFNFYVKLGEAFYRQSFRAGFKYFTQLRCLEKPSLFLILKKFFLELFGDLKVEHANILRKVIPLRTDFKSTLQKIVYLKKRSKSIKD